MHVEAVRDPGSGHARLIVRHHTEHVSVLSRKPTGGFDIYAGFTDYGDAASAVFRRIADEYGGWVKDSE